LKDKVGDSLERQLEQKFPNLAAKDR
jgi:hypothetical protein